MPFAVKQESIALVAFLVGVALVIVSVEAFIEAVAESALALGVSGFFLTVILAGTDIENAVLELAGGYHSLRDDRCAVVSPVHTRCAGPVLLFVLALDGTLLGVYAAYCGVNYAL